MPEKDSKVSAELSAGAKYALIGTIVTAAVGLIGTGLTLYFNYLEKIEPQKLSIQATQTAEMRLTQAALNITPTFTPTPTPTPTNKPADTLTPTLTPSLTPIEPSPTETYLVGGEKYCVDVHALNVRAGPATVFGVVGTLDQGDCLSFDAYVVFEGGYYWVEIAPHQSGFTRLGGAWVYGLYLRPQDFDQRLPVVTPPPFPTPTAEPVG